MPKTNSQAKMVYTTDEYGQEILIKNGSLQVMMEWEKPYMQACIDALKPKGDVLEIGFGLGYSSQYIQEHHPKSHTIIESDPTVIKHLKTWAKKYPNVKIIEGTWQDSLQKLGQFDSIFFDDFTPPSPSDLKQLENDTKSYEDTTEQIQSMKDEIAENLKLYEGIKFSNEDLKTFGQEMQSREDVSQQDVTDFINTLVDMGNITAQQRDAFLKLNLPQKEAQKNRIWIHTANTDEERFAVFAEICLNNHMRPGANLIAAMRSEESLKNNPQFKQKILSRKDVKFTEKKIDIDIPPNCQYYQGNFLLIGIIEHKG